MLLTGAAAFLTVPWLLLTARLTADELDGLFGDEGTEALRS